MRLPDIFSSDKKTGDVISDTALINSYRGAMD